MVIIDLHSRSIFMIDHSKLTITIINSNIEFDFLHHKNPYFIYIFIYF